MIVVTGAAGFIGSNLTSSLLKRATQPVVVVDTFAGGNHATERFLTSLPVRERVVKDSFPRWLEHHHADVRGILHMGACSDTTVKDRSFVMAVNFEYTRTLWTFCTKNAIPFVYASSAATYGDGSRGYDDEADPRTLEPLNLYGESKQRFDLWALEQKETPPRWAGLKFFNVYGPHEEHKERMASVAYHGYHQIKQTGKVRLFESHRDGIAHGGQRRDFLSVEDAVDATLHLFDTPVSTQAPNGLYNVGTGTARSFKELALAVFAAMKVEPVVEYFPMPTDLRGKYQYFTEAKVAKLRRAGFNRPFLTIEEGVARYVKYLASLPTPAEGRA